VRVSECKFLRGDPVRRDDHGAGQLMAIAGFPTPDPVPPAPDPVPPTPSPPGGPGFPDPRPPVPEPPPAI